MARLTSEGARLAMQDGPLPAGSAIASASAAAPCVLSMAGPPPFAVGAIVVVAGSGWASLDGRAFRVDVIDGALVMLGDSDASGELAAVAGGATAAPVGLIDFCTASLDVARPASADFDTTTIYDEARTIRTGLAAINTWSAEGFWDITDLAQQRVHQLLRSRAIVVFTARYQDDSGLVFTANLNNFETRSGIDLPVSITTGGTISGPLGVFLPEPVFGFIVAGSPAVPSSPDWIIGGSPSAPSLSTIVAGQVGQFA